MRRSRIVIACAVLAMFFVTACELLLDNGGLVAQKDGGVEAGVSVSDASVDAPACVTVQPPTLVIDSGVTGAGNVYVFAIRTLEVGAAPGFDLDHTCTCCACAVIPPNDAGYTPNDGGKNSCVVPGPNQACDFEGGIDDEFSQLLNLATAAFQTHIIDQADQVAGCGVRTMLLGLSDYNGLADDPQVELTATTSYGILDPHDGGEPADAGIAYCGGDAGDPYYRPKWDGTDLWAVAANTTTKGVPLSTTPMQAHVSNYQLVLDTREPGQPDPLVLTVFLFGTTPVQFGSPVIVATMTPLYGDGSPIPLDGGVPIDPPVLFAMTQGQIAGRANRDDVVRAAGLAPFDLTTGTLVCQTSLFIQNAANLCGYADISLDSHADGTGASCNAYSTSLAFTAYPAAVGQTNVPIPTADASVCTASLLTCDSD